jgi:hypothetical protein
MKKVQDILIIITALLLFASLFAGGWLAVGFAAGAAITATVAIILPNFSKNKNNSKD